MCENIMYHFFIIEIHIIEKFWREGVTDKRWQNYLQRFLNISI